MQWNTFARSALFAALAAGGVLPWLLVTGPLLGTRRAIVLYLVGLTATYLGGLARPARRWPIALGTAAVGAGVALVAHTSTELVVGLAVLLGVVRSASLYRQTTARAVATEVTLIGAGLLFARFLVGNAALSLVLAVWGFFLVQSLFFLVGGVHARPPAGARPDPFDEAYARVVAMMERGGV